jgi:2-oxoglutarate ferredoxin oxidoreductase subunit beta
VGPTNDPAKAARRIMTDDGFNVGVLYRGDRKPYQPPIGGVGAELADLERDFEL